MSLSPSLNISLSSLNRFKKSSCPRATSHPPLLSLVYIACALLFLVAPVAVAQSNCDRQQRLMSSTGATSLVFTCNLTPYDSMATTAYFGSPPEATVLTTLSGGYWIGDLGGHYTTQGSNSCPTQNFSPQLKIHFFKPVMNVSIYVGGDTVAGVTATGNQGESGTVVNTNGLYEVKFFQPGLTDVTIKNNTFSTNGSWNLWIGGVSLYLDPKVCDPCLANQIARPQIQTEQSNWPAPARNWSMQAEISDNDGLVLRNVKLGERYMAEKISVPYYTLATSAFSKARGELKPGGDAPSMRSRLVNYYVSRDEDKMVVEAEYLVDKIPTTSQSCLRITQRYEFYREGVLPCEPSKTVKCSNYKSIVKYKFNGQGTESLWSLNIAQRNRYAVGNYANNTVSLFRDCDGASDCIRAGGLVFKDKNNPLYFEYNGRVIENGRSTGSWDNFHQTYRGVVEEPLTPSLIANNIWGGCPECVHNHWRWGSSIAPIFVDPQKFNNFQPSIPPGSTQDLDVAVVKFKPGEDDPLDYTALISQEPIRHSTNSSDLREQVYAYTAPDGVVVWFSATGHLQEDSFFIQPGFFGPSDSNVDASITRDTSALSSSYASGPPQLKQTSFAATDTASEDGPISVRFADRYLDGPTTFTDIDPSTLGALPPGYSGYNNVGYDIQTEAEISGPHNVTFNVGSITDQSVFDNLRVFHSEVDPADPTKTIWVDRTILSPETPAPDFTNKIINARVNFMGSFVVATLTDPQPVNTSMADLAVTLSESSDPITAGSNLTYALNVTNNGPQAATEVTLVNGLAPNVDLVSATTNQGSCIESEGNIICKLNPIPAGGNTALNVVVKVSENRVRFPPQGITITNTAFVKAKEGDGVETNNSATVSTTVLPDSNQTPTVSITSPATNSLFVGPANLSITANASDVDGTIAKVDYFDNGELIGTSTDDGTNQYSLAWNNVSFGSHTLIARATDNLGKENLSGSVNIHVNGSASVSITSPAAGGAFNKPASINVTANASYSGGSISKVEFYANGWLIGEGTLTGSNQYRVTWVNVVAGSYSLVAVATDNSGVLTLSSPISIIVNDPPAVTITSPTSSERPTAPVTLTANASDRDGVVNAVDFYENGSLIARGSYIGNFQYAAVWNNATAGSHTVTATAQDNRGASSTSAPVSITINAPPVVVISSPADGTQYSAPANISISASASDSDGSISKVEFYANGNVIGTGTAAGANQYSFTWNSVKTGIYSLTAIATDNNGGATTSIISTVRVTSPALLVAGSTTLNSSDAAIKTRLEALSYVVTVRDGTSALSTDANGKSVVVISSTVTPTSVGTKFRTVTVPVVLWESGSFYDMGMTAKQTTNFGTATSQTQVKITNAAHSMAAGLSGTVTVVSAASTFDWGKPNANAASVATLVSDATKIVIFGYDRAAAMPGLAAPSRRVGIFMHDATAANFTNNGMALFDAAIKWATGP